MTDMENKDSCIEYSHLHVNNIFILIFIRNIQQHKTMQNRHRFTMYNCALNAVY